MMLPSLPYLAGFFDGEGSIGLYRNGQGHGSTLRVQITQNCSPLADALLEAIKENWGGSLSLMNRDRKRPAWSYQASSSKGVQFLRDMRPYLILKAEQADIALAWWDQKPERTRGAAGRFEPPTPEAVALTAEVDALLRRLKKE